ncbi:MAG: hypothetical protein ACYSW3_25410 [Planctomycetota bacterium]|jgi:hypothetical protein
MAFQTGTQVRPELGRADVSGFARGGELIAAGIGAGLRNFIEGQENVKKINNATDALTEGVKGNQYLQALMGLSKEQVESDALRPAVKKFVKGFGADKAMALGAQLNLAIIKETLDRDKISPKTRMDLTNALTEQNLEIKDGKLYRKRRIGRDELLSVGDPKLQSILDLEGGREALYGYDPDMNLELVPTEESSLSDVPLDFVAPTMESIGRMSPIGPAIRGISTGRDLGRFIFDTFQGDSEQ